MAIPSTPTNLLIQPRNAQVLVSCDYMPNAISYIVQRSIDGGITYATVASPVLPQYLDTTVVIGTQYWYQMAAVGTTGTSAYQTLQSDRTSATAAAAPIAEMSLNTLRRAARQRADRVNSNFVTDAEWNNYINQSMYELYDLLITTDSDYFIAPRAQFVTVGGNQAFYPLPDGKITFTNPHTNATFTAPPFYKLTGIDLALSTAQNAQTTLSKYNFQDRNKFLYPNSASTIYGVFNMQYRMMGNNLEFIPVPSANQPITIIYIPRLPELMLETDVTTLGYSGWLEYVIVKAAILALTKEESDTSALTMQLAQMAKRIEETATNRDEGRPDTITDVRNAWGDSSGGGFGRIGGF